MSRLCILFLSIVTWSTLNRGEDSAADVAIIPEQTPIGYVLVSRQNDSDAHEFAWSSPTNSTPNSHDRFALNPRTGALTLAKSLLGFGGCEFRLSIDVSTARRVVRVVELRIVVTKAISCPLTTINATLSAEAEVGTIVTFFRCKQPNDLPLVYYGGNDYFALDRTENGSFLYVNRSLERFDDDSATIIALRIVVALEFENAIRINETIRVRVSIQQREFLCKNGTVSTSTVAPRPLHIDLTEYCGVHVSYGLRDVSEAPNATLSGTIVSIANRLKAGTYRIFYEARRGNRTTTGSIRIFAIAPAIFPKNVSISLPETENRGKNLMVFKVRSFPLEEETRFALNDDDEGSLPFRLTSTNETEATLSLATSLDYEKPDQKKVFTFRVVARSNGGATANATVTVRLINANDNPPVLTIKEITIPDSIHLNESIAQIGWVDADSSKSTVTMEMEFTRVVENKARRVEPNPFRLNSTSGALSLVRRLDNDDAVCCYSVYVRLTDYGFPDMAPLSKSQAITERIVARLNSSRCTTGCEYTGTISPTEPESSNGFRKEYIYAIIAGSIGCFLLVLFVVATAIFWRRATMKQQRLDQILLNEILPSVERKENASRRSTVSKQPRLPTVYEDSDETDDEGDATTTTTTRRAPSSGNVETKKFDSFWTIPRRNLRLGYTIRKGSYTDVYYGKVMGLRGRDKTDVAIKILKANSSDEDKRLFVEELDILKDTLRHPNVISFWGACVSDGDRQPMMIVYEFAPHGNLRDFLRKARCQEMDGTPPSLSLNPVDTTTKTATITLLPSELLTFALQIAKGMEHLTAMKRVHGNLAARNVLVGSKFVMKLCDFGLVNQRMSGRSVGEEFEKWMAVELFNENNPRTIQSDIWSYGVVLWEILTLGDSPYSEIHLEDLYTKLKGGYRMKKPDNCSGKLYEIMKNCWAVQPMERPLFRELAKRIEQLLVSDANYLILETSTDEHEDTFANPLYEPDEGEKTREIDTIVKQLDEKISELVSII